MNVDILLLVLFLVVAGSLAMAGLWSNLLTLVNVIFAGLLAVSCYEPLAKWLDGQMASLTYIWDFVALWLIFAAAMGLSRAVTDAVSPVKVKFKRPVDQAGGILLACWVAWVVVCFTTLTLHTAPLSRNFLGFQPEPSSRMFFGLAPDHRWLGFVQKESTGALARTATLKFPDGHQETGPNKFDPQGEFVLKYSERRSKFEKLPGFRVPEQR